MHFDKAVRNALLRGRSASACPDENLMAAYIEARLTGEEKARVEDHASMCASCREVLAMAAGFNEPSSVAATDRAARRFPWRFFLPAAAAAAVLLAVAGSVLLLQTFREKGAPQSAALREPEPDRAAAIPEPPASPPAGAKSKHPPPAAAPAPARELEPGSRAPERPEPAPAPALPEQELVAEDSRAAGAAVPMAEQAAGAAAERRQVTAYAVALGDPSRPPGGASTESRLAYRRLTAAEAVAASSQAMDAAGSSAALRRVGDLSFRRIGEYWVDTRCTEQKQESPRVVTADPAMRARILEEHPGLKELLDAGSPVILRYQGDNYLIAK